MKLPTISLTVVVFLFALERPLFQKRTKSDNTSEKTSFECQRKNNLKGLCIFSYDSFESIIHLMIPNAFDSFRV